MDKLRIPQAIGTVFTAVVAVAAVADVTPRQVNVETRLVETRANWYVGVGHRVDNLDWSVAGDVNGRNPNVLSELTWRDLGIVQLELGGNMVLDNSVYLRGNLAYGRIYAGDNQDSDYAGDNRTIEYSRSNNGADDGSVSDLSVGVGYQFRPGERTRLTPIVGYSRHEQNLKMRDGYQTIPPLGAFAGLDSSYDTRWSGPWVGVDFSHVIDHRFSLFGAAEYHQGDYKADANWNLRDDFAHPVSFTQKADAGGTILMFGGAYRLTDAWTLRGSLRYQNWSTDPGVDRVFFANGGSVETRLNEVNWDSRLVMFSVSYVPNAPR